MQQQLMQDFPSTSGEHATDFTPTPYVPIFVKLSVNFSDSIHHPNHVLLVYSVLQNLSNTSFLLSMT